jgi:UDP-2-acetamido-2-deoxy-ribo-hexuluronate aminotransferase
MKESKIQMVNLFDQYLKIKTEIDKEIQNVINSTSFINGKKVTEFELNLSNYLGCKHTISCANGTDALQIALMALDLNIGDEILVPAFTYVATAEAIALLGLVPIMIDVDDLTFNINTDNLNQFLTSKTKAIIPVHLFGQVSNMEEIMNFATENKLWVIEDNAQSLGSDFIYKDGNIKKAGTIGHIGCTSFFPTKNLGCFGDGGALFTNDDSLNEKIRMIANHGQKQKYHHSLIGCNSRLDTIQAAILDVKLSYFEVHLASRRKSANLYNDLLNDCDILNCPYNAPYAVHTYNQYTLVINEGKRDQLVKHLTSRGIPSMVYYPIPLYKQEAFTKIIKPNINLKNTEMLCKSVLSIPIHTELNEEEINIITEAIKSF